MREAIAICRSLPGRLAIRVGIYIAELRGGFWGAWAGGRAFILPNIAIVAALGSCTPATGSPGSAWRTGCNGRSRRQSPQAHADGPAGRGATRARPVRADRVRTDHRQAAAVLSQGRLAHLRQRPRHRAIPRAGIGAAIRLARPTTIPHRSRDRHDQPWAGRDHRDVCRLSRRRLLGLHRLDHRNLPAIFSVRADRSAPARAEPWQPKCAGICKRRLRRGDRNHFGRLHSARPHRDRRLAHGPDWARVSRRVVSLERQPIPCSSPRPRSLA
jgi:hypothetical protein